MSATRSTNGRSKNVKAILTTEFSLDERLGITVPLETHERYELVDSTVTSAGTYSRFRRFGVEAKEDVALPPPEPSSAPR